VATRAPDLLAFLSAHRRVASTPHHFHNETNQVFASPLSGDPLVDLPVVFGEVERWIATQ